MGSSSSTPVKKAESVEVTHHNDMVEFRFDHLALGSSAILFIALALIIFYFCRKHRRSSSHSMMGPGFQNFPIQQLQPSPSAALPYQASSWQVPIMWHVSSGDMLNIMAAFRNSPPSPLKDRSSEAQHRSEPRIVDVEKNKEVRNTVKTCPRAWDT